MAAPNVVNLAAKLFAIDPTLTPGLVIDLIRREASVHGKLVALTGIEFKLLLALARAPGQPQSRESLNGAVQVGNYRPLDRTVDVQVGRLRRKLSSAAHGTEWLSTVRGEGYVFSPSLAA